MTPAAAMGAQVTAAGAQRALAARMDLEARARLLDLEAAAAQIQRDARRALRGVHVQPAERFDYDFRGRRVSARAPLDTLPDVG